MLRIWIILILVYASMAFFVAYGIYQNALNAALLDAQEKASVRLSEASSRLRLQLDGYRALVNYAAKNDSFAAALISGDTSEVSDALSYFRLTYGPWHVDLVNKSGRIIASSGPDRVDQFFAGALVQAALNGRLGSEQAIEGGARLFRFSRGIRGQDQKPIGAVVVSADMASLEFEWPVTPEPITFFDAEKLSFSANRPDLVLLSDGGDDEVAQFPIAPLTGIGGLDLWRFNPKTGGAIEVFRLRQPIERLGLTAEIFVDVAPVKEAALLRFRLALALAGVLGLVAAVAFQQRRRLTLEARHSATLEARVESRTAELRDAQDELVEASKLAALGRLSAGVSHELNQPLAAVLNFAENGRALIERGKTTIAAENFERISGQIKRINRIIGNLRAFARQEVAPVDRIDFVAVTKAAITLIEAEVAAANVTMTTQFPEHPVFITGGHVRLEQVILNLVTNALDAMAEAPVRQLDITLSETGKTAQLTIRDTGAGIQDPDRVFEPFYTTKELGASKGIGMGLALSFGIIGRFGGAISCQNHAMGAEFKIELPKTEVVDVDESSDYRG